MHLFEIIALDIEGVPAVPLFAESYDLAVHHYVIWWMNHREGELPDLEVRKRNPDWPGLDAGLLAKALDLDLPGVGRFDPVAGWTIYFPDHEAVGVL